MVTKYQFIEALTKNIDIQYDRENGIMLFKGKQVDVDRMYVNFLKNNGMSFNCICDCHFECMSILECTECGTVVKYYYDENYEPNFKCPVCTDYETGYEFHTKEEIENSPDLKAIIEMYRDMDRIQHEQDMRIRRRNGKNDWQLTKPRTIRTKNGAYRFGLVIESIMNKNKLKGLKLEVTRFENDGAGLSSKWEKRIPLSASAIQNMKRQKYLEKHPELNPLEQFKGRSLTDVMEDAAVLKMNLRNKQQDSNE